MDEYSITFSVEGYYTWSGKAKSKDEAKKKALDTVCEADFGELENVDINVCYIEKK